jgi:hypothetical protein
VIPCAKNNQLNGKIINIWKSSEKNLPLAYDGKKILLTS